MPIQVGEPLAGDITDPQTPWVYSFEGAAGETLIIEAHSESVDTYLYVVDAGFNVLAENDDYSAEDLNPFIQFVVPANGAYYVAVYGYSPGPFTLVLRRPEETDSGSPAGPVGSPVPKGEVYTGELDNEGYFATIPLSGVKEGDTIIVDAVATSGDLDPYLVLLYGDAVVLENDDRAADNVNPRLEYPNAPAGDYTLIITRYGFEQGQSTGAFEVLVEVSAGINTLTTADLGHVEVNPVVSGYPEVVAPTLAEWTVLAYLGGDNNLEDGLLNDMNEFEIAGGSSEKVRILVLMDRSGQYDESNGNWTDTRVFEMGADVSDDALSSYPPTLDTSPMADLGELDTSYSKNLLDFLVWGIRNYPAKQYAVILSDHGGAWTGIVTDDTTGAGILTIRDLKNVFRAALEATNLPKFDLLVNDACLMSSVEYYAALSPYFDYAISSPEVTLNPSFDMTLLTRTLNENPDIDPGQLGEMLVDKYLQDMQALSPDEAPVLGGAVTDLRRFNDLALAVDNFTRLVNSNPAAFASLLGRVRANTYTYSFFLPEEEFGPATNIDLGDFMRRIVETADDAQLTSAAQAVLDALNTSRVYGAAGPQLAKQTSYYNIYFPTRGGDFDAAYHQQSPLDGWGQMLANYFSHVGVGAVRAVSRTGVEAPVSAPSVAPEVTITNVFPTQTSYAFPVSVSMEVVGRNIAHGNFTVDQIQTDGSAVRLDTSRIVTEVIVNDVVDYQNVWHPGVDDSHFVWEVTLPVVTDGSVTSNELVVTAEGVSSLAGRYRYPNAEDWLDVTVIFDDDGNTSSVVSRRPGGTALASVVLDAGGEFQTYRSVVTSDGRIKLQPGTSYIWPQEGIRWYEAPAPSGVYDLGFLVEAFGGVTGFASARVTVNNEGINPDLRGYVDLNWGIRFQHPADWFDVSYFPDAQFLQTSSLDSTQYMFVYPLYDPASTDLETIAAEIMERYDITLDGVFTPITVAGQDALEFTLSYENDTGKFNGRAFVVYLDSLSLGLVFSAETLDGIDNAPLYQLFLDQQAFFDPQAVQAQDTGVWETDSINDEAEFPVRADWLEGFDADIWRAYTPGGDFNSLTFAAVTRLEGNDARAVLTDLLSRFVEQGDGYELLGIEPYYAENNIWQAAAFVYNLPDGSISGRMFVTVKDGAAYAFWFEAPAEVADETFRTVFYPMLDGFAVSD